MNEWMDLYVCVSVCVEVLDESNKLKSKESTALLVDKRFGWCHMCYRHAGGRASVTLNFPFALEPFVEYIDNNLFCHNIDHVNEN